MGYSTYRIFNYSGNKKIHFLDHSLASKNIEEVLKSPEFKGKVVYVDIWASWCGECIKQFPYAKSLKTHFRAEPIAYLYISYNNKFRIDHQTKWKALIKKNNLEGYHLEVNKDFYEDLWSRIKTSTTEKITIPRYLIVGKDGKIVNKNAANPESEAIVYEQIQKALQ
ncbi:Redoxin [Solitalea koreensis]|uniref:Redoxin n=1 Tax=Solitalea koreensis TaxID=543615 RepID=A0A521EIA4_9SPHI|nr:Redoxin [Solitalea koreensis]